jgi:hypothetical protein
MNISKQENNRYAIFQQIVQNKSKGYWRVKSVDILTRRINQKQNLSHNLYLLNKIKKLSIHNLPSFQITKCALPPSNPVPPPTKEQSTLFLTNTPFKPQQPLNNTNNIRNTLFGKFPNEASIYNNMNMFSINASTNRVYPRTLKEVIRDSKKIVAYDETLKKIRSALMRKQTYDSGNSSFSYGCSNNAYRNNNNYYYYKYISNVESSNEGSQSVSWRKDVKECKLTRGEVIARGLGKVKRGDMRIRSNNSFGCKNNNNNNNDS